MCFTFFRHKKEETSRTFEGRFVTDEEIEDMSKPKVGTFIQKEFDEIKEMMDDIRYYCD